MMAAVHRHRHRPLPRSAAGMTLLEMLLVIAEFYHFFHNNFTLLFS